MSRVALGIAISERVKSGKVFVGALDFASGKTKDAATVLKSVADFTGNTLVCLSNPSENTIIRIYSIDGKEVFANNFGNGATNNTFQLNVSELSNGYYFLSLQNGNQIQRVPFVKE
jgi:ribosomal protein L4